MNTQIIGLLAETSIHPGAGQSAGIVDLPVAREAATDYPVVPGSSLKGALLGLARSRQLNDIKRFFGSLETQTEDGKREGGAGSLLVSDARLLLLPVRSLQSAYKWVTCPHLLERFSRDSQRGGSAPGLPKWEVALNHYLGAGNGDLFLEERQLKQSAGLPGGLLSLIEPLIPHDATRQRLAEQLVVLHDDDFAWFARNGLAVQARNVLDEKNKTSLKLWYEETIPADALFYTLLAERQTGAINAIAGLFKEHAYLQVSGNETVGMGWFAVALP